jgi:twinkle protein
MPVNLIDQIEIAALPKRGLNEETCRKFRYGVATHNGKPVQVANYCGPDGQVKAQKLRFADKSFTVLGDMKGCGLFGQNLWRDGGKILVITEGEIDAMSVSQLQDNKWPVVSIPSGAAGAEKAIRANLEWVEKFETVVFMFDMDEPGQAAATDCAMLLTPGKAKIAQLPLKDPNECLVAGRGRDVIDAMWGAKVYRPDGIIDGRDLWAEINAKDQPSIPYPWSGLQDKLHGLRLGELITLTSGSGIGKSSVCRELAHWLLGMNCKVGYIALEESVRRTALGIMSVELSKKLHIDKERDAIPEDEMRLAFDRTVGSGKMFLYDHFGSCDSENLLARIRYMVRGLECKWIFLDHISIVVSGIDDGEERRIIDNTMTKLRMLVQELDCGMILVSHLKRPKEGAHEEGGQTSLAQLRGSGAIGQLSDIVIGLERNQQNEAKKNITTMRVLKNRFGGDTGKAGELSWNKDTGRLKENRFEFAADELPDF